MREIVQVAVRGNDLSAGTEPEVKGVAKDDLDTHRLQLFGCHRLDGAVGADWHEGRRLDVATRKIQPTPPGGLVAAQQFKNQTIPR